MREQNVEVHSNLGFQLSLVRLLAPQGLADKQIAALEQLLSSPKAEISPKTV